MISAAEANSFTQARIDFLARAEIARKTTLLEVRKIAERNVDQAIQEGKFSTGFIEFQNENDYPIGVSLFLDEAQKLGYKVLSGGDEKIVKFSLSWENGAEIPEPIR